MRLVCSNCGSAIDFSEEEIRGLPVEPGDTQLFQLRHLNTLQVRNYIFQCPACKGIRARIDPPPASDWAKERVVSTKVFDDPTPKGQINNRICRVPMEIADSATELDEAAKYQLFGLLLLCGKKLVAVWKHMCAYAAIEDRLIEEEQQRAAANEHHVYLEQAQDLLIEFDEFLVQLKSSLDYVVKVPRPILGPKIWAIWTFGDKGDGVINALEHNVPQQQRRIGKGIARLLVKKHQPWLKDVIDARDRLNHMIGPQIAPEEFMVFAAPREGSALIYIHRPRWSAEQTVREFMGIVWENLIRLFEDFVISCLMFKFKTGLALYHGRVEPGSAQSPWRVTTLEERDRAVQQPGWEKVTFD